MELDDVRAFVAVASTGSVSRAAREIFRTQPAVTRRVQRLEHTLGVRLLDRRRRPFTLTPAGEAALVRCRDLLASAQELQSAAGTGTGTELAGELRIGIGHSLAELTLEGPVNEVQRRFPKVGLKLSTGWSGDLLERVRGQILDAGFLLLPRGETPPASTHGVAIAEERLIVVAPGQRGSGAVRVGDLAGQSWVLNPEGCAGRAALARALLGAGADLRVGVETYSYELQLSLVAKGRGFGLVPSRFLMKSRYRARVQALRVRGLDFRMTIWSVRGRPGRALEPVLDELTRVVRERLVRPRSRP